MLYSLILCSTGETIKKLALPKHMLEVPHIMVVVVVCIISLLQQEAPQPTHIFGIESWTPHLCFDVMDKSLDDSYLLSCFGTVVLKFFQLNII